MSLQATSAYQQTSMGPEPVSPEELSTDVQANALALRFQQFFTHSVQVFQQNPPANPIFYPDYPTDPRRWNDIGLPDKTGAYVAAMTVGQCLKQMSDYPPAAGVSGAWLPALRSSDETNPLFCMGWIPAPAGTMDLATLNWFPKAGAPALPAPTPAASALLLPHLITIVGDQSDEMNSLSVRVGVLESKTSD